MKLSKKLITAGICAGMSVAMLTGCSSTEKKLDPNETVATMGDTKLSLGVANLMYRYSQVETGSYIRMLLGDDGSNLWEQDLTGSGSGYGLSLKDNTLSEYKKMLVLEQHMSEYGVEITEDDKAAITAAATQFIADNDPATLEQMTATQETVERLLTLYTIENRMQTAIEAAADVEVTDEEAAQKKIRYAYFAIPAAEETETETEAVSEATSEEATEAVSEAASEEATEAVSEVASEEATEAVSEAVSEEATEAESETAAEEETEELNEAGYVETAERTATREAVQGIIDEVKAGTSFDDAVAAYDPEKSIIENHYGTSSTLSAVITTAADELADGEITSTPVEAENGFYIVEMVTTFDEEATAEEKEELMEERRSDFYNETLTGWNTEELTIDEKVWDKVYYADDFRAPAAETEIETEVAVDPEEATELLTEETTEAASEVVSEKATEAASEAVSEEVTETATEATSETETETASEAK